ncbi:hypothetical protein N7492_004477 [Penicillium capsulatum]|uniref:AB hydrolase-1 domain-containing protein n=1 Tax=Penicillium capsulatum TaxID=69766 RepID=A0A9W9I7P8_9EURO|nr:hypothetical protein N7492_004477 [Penicillium capsulatum]KAJ6136404.1 hypothetical protein N7512_001564 [Penicillium capsulatum]
MKSFKLQLPQGVITGRISIPQPRAPNKYVPLIVCLHGGGADATYFDASPEYSIAAVSDPLGIPVIAINRPSYAESSRHPALPITDSDTYSEQHGRYLNSVVLPALWQEYGERSGAAGIVLLSHSVGAMVGTIIAGSYTGTEGYPLAGLITSGIGIEHDPEASEAFLAQIDRTQPYVYMDPAMKRMVAYQLQRNIVDHEAVKHFTWINNPVPVEELLDINTKWDRLSPRYSPAVKVPLMYGVAEFDGLWSSSREAIDQYRDAFPASPRKECGIIPMAPHCQDVSFQGKGWLARCCGFAIECAGWYDMTE